MFWNLTIGALGRKRPPTLTCHEAGREPPEFPGYLPFAKAIGLTLFSTILSLTFISAIITIDAESYQPCNDPVAGCLYQKTFAAGHVATTQGYFAIIQNGRDEILGMSPDHTWTAERPSWVLTWKVWENWQPFQYFMLRAIALYTYIPGGILGRSTYQPPALCPNMTVTDMHSYCASMEMKAAVQNHLIGPGLASFIGLTIVWCMVRILHDCLLLLEQREAAAYAGCASIAAQVMAAMTGVYWAFGSTSVFVAVHPAEDCACFYQMPPLQALVTLVSPILLLGRTYFDTLSGVRGIIHGDYLRYQPHRIPHHVEKCSSSWASGDLLIWKDRWEPQERMAPYVYWRLFISLRIMLMFFFYLQVFLLAPLFPASLRRSEELIGGFSEQISDFPPVAWPMLGGASFLIHNVNIIAALLMVLGVCVQMLLSVYQPGAVKQWARRLGATLGYTFYLTWITWFPTSGVSQREALILRAQFQGIGHFYLGLALSISPILWIAIKHADALRTLAGRGPMFRSTTFLKFCEKHSDVVQSFPEMKELLFIAQTPLSRCWKSFVSQPKSLAKDASETVTPLSNSMSCVPQ